MRIAMCDVCLSEGAMTKATRRVGFRGGSKADVCDKHRKHFEHTKTSAEFAGELLKLMDKSL